MTDAEWLRERPEIAEAIWTVIEEWGNNLYGDTEKFATEVVTAILPLLRAAIREDVVRELAGEDVGTERLLIEGIQAADDLERGFLDREGFASDFSQTIIRERATAHAQGRAAALALLSDPDDRMVEAAAEAICCPNGGCRREDKSTPCVSLAYKIALDKAKAAIRAAMKAAGE